MLNSIGIGKKSKNERERQAKVIEIDLFQPTSSKYPIFDYEEIQRSLGIYDEEDIVHDEDAEKIVKRLQEKYGSKAKKKGINFQIEDVMDKGMGYDQNDDFIDDTMAYDEWIPSTMDTEKGGHYVNRGVLEFRQIDIESSTSSQISRNLTEDEDEEDDHMEKSSNQNGTPTKKAESGQNPTKIKSPSKCSASSSEPIRLSSFAVAPTHKMVTINAALSKVRGSSSGESS